MQRNPTVRPTLSPAALLNRKQKVVHLLTTIEKKQDLEGSRKRNLNKKSCIECQETT